MTLRNMQLISNFPNMSVEININDARIFLVATATTMSTVHTLNYLSPPTQQVADFFNQKMWIEQNVVGGSTGFENVQVSFWDLMNDFISAIRTSSQIAVHDLRDPDYAIKNMIVTKRAVAFM